MLLTEYDEEKELKKLANSYYNEGLEKGEELGKASIKKDACLSLLSNGISDEIIKSSLSLSVEELNSFRREWEALKG